MSDSLPTPDTTDVAPAESAPAETTPSPADIPPKPTPPAPEAEQDATKDAPEGENPEIARLRREAANYRTKLRDEEAARQAEAEKLAETEKNATELRDMLAKLQQVLNPDAPTEEAPDPVKLAEQLAAAEQAREALAAEKDAKIRELTVKAALPGVLSKAQADPDLTVAVLTASGALGTLDPTADTFASDLEAVVAAAVDKNPKLRTTPAVVRSGAEVPGGSPASNQLTREDVARLSKDDPAALVKAMSDGRLKGLGVGG